MIPESYYVNVNINYKQPTSILATVPMSVLVSATATATKEYTTLQQVQSDYSEDTAPELIAATMYFGNGGTKLLVFKQEEGATIEATLTSLLSTYSDFIWVTFAQEDLTLDDLETIAKTLASSTQGLAKFLAQTTNLVNATTTLANDGYNNVALVYSDEETVTPYSAIVIPAYFSNIDLTYTDALKSMVHTIVNAVPVSQVTSQELDTLYADNWNVIVNLGNRYNTFDGGKMVDGQPIHSAWGFAIFKENCEDVITDLLVEKLPYANSSNAVIENVLNQICNTFVNNGLIGTEKEYTQPTQTTQYNGVTYTLIREGQVLSNGYTIYSIPIANAELADRQAGKIPPIYIYAIIDDVIRQVKIIGEVSK